MTAVSADDTLAAGSGDMTLPAEDSIVLAGSDSIELPEPEPDSPAQPDVLPEVPGDSLSAEAGTQEPATEPETAEAGEEPAEPKEPTFKSPAEDRMAYEAMTRGGARRGGVVPLVLGGVAAAAIGYFAGTLTSDTDALTGRIAAQDRAIAELKAAIPAAADTSAIEAATGANTTAVATLTGRLDDLTARLAALEAQVGDVAKGAMGGSVPDGAMKAYEEELTRLQEAMRAQRAEVEQMVTNARNMQADADAQTARTAARAALTAIMAAFDSGAAYTKPLADLRAAGQQVPGPVAEHVDGIPTLADLRADFPPAAREALARTRGTGNDSVGSFFRTQLGIRSLEPKAGDDPDAILSRAEAAVADGDLATALNEIGTLPAEAQDALAGWKADAEIRLATVEAAQGLMAELNSN